MKSKTYFQDHVNLMSKLLYLGLWLSWFCCKRQTVQFFLFHNAVTNKVINNRRYPLQIIWCLLVSLNFLNSLRNHSAFDEIDQPILEKMRIALIYENQI